MAEASVTGVQKAAILLMSLGEGDAAQVLKYLDPKEVQILGTAMTQIKDVSRDQVKEVLRTFCIAAGSVTALGIDSNAYIRNVLREALGEERGNSMLDRILHSGDTSGLDMLKWMDPKAVADLIRLEHPQIIAIILSFLEQDQTAEILPYLPQEIAADVMMRIATLDGVQGRAIKELSDILENTFVTASTKTSAASGGVKKVANIVNNLDSSLGNELIERIERSDAMLAEQIQDLMFVFENLIEVDGKGIQALLRDVQSETLVIAMKGAAVELREKFFDNMSSRAAELMRDDLENKGPVKLSDVEAAQKEILQIARRLMDSGEIAVGGGGGEEYV